ncbi:MAG: hypothetical protein AB8B50_01850 [Pirellulaceae bacterium]
MSITFRCESGHKIRADEKFAGRQVRCPACSRPTDVPDQSALAFRETKELPAITESGIQRVLGEVAPLPEMPESPDLCARQCPRCRKKLTKAYSLCPNCKLFVGAAVLADSVAETPSELL